MARRILYNPTDYVEASMPFYDNLIGIITDQTDRISRNIQMAKEKELLEEDREWQESQLQLQLDARREGDEAQMDFQAEQNAADRSMQGDQHRQELQLGWAKLNSQYVRDQQGQVSDAMRDYQTRVNDIHSTYRQGGWGSSETPLKLNVVPDPNTGNPLVVDAEGRETKVLGSYDEYVQSHETLVNFTEMFTGGKNVVQWAEDNLQMDADTYADAEDGSRVVSGQDMINLVNQIRTGVDVPGSMETLRNIMDDDSNVRLLYKEDPDADIRNQMFVTDKITTGMRNLTNANYYSALFKNNAPDEPTEFISGIDNPSRYIPTPFDHELFNMPNVTFKGQSIGQMEQAYQNLRRLGEQTGMKGIGDDIENVRQGVTAFTELADNLLTNHPEVIPDNLKHVPRYKLIPSLKLNRKELENPQPDIRNVFEFPGDEKEVEVLSKQVNKEMFKDRSKMDQYMIEQGFKPDPKNKYPWE